MGELPFKRSDSHLRDDCHLLLLLSKFNASSFSKISSSDKSDFQPYAANTTSSSRLCARASQVGRAFLYGNRIVFYRWHNLCGRVYFLHWHPGYRQLNTGHGYLCTRKRIPRFQHETPRPILPIQLDFLLLQQQNISLGKLLPK
jgi:hypothetical protein